MALPAGAVAVYNSSGLDYYRHADWLGSSRLASTTSKAVYSDVSYAPYGEAYNQYPPNVSDLSFTGQNQDTASGLYDFLYREQSSVQGRWISPDPAGLAAVNPANPQSWNRYAYVGNNPLSMIDPLGLIAKLPLLPPYLPLSPWPPGIYDGGVDFGGWWFSDAPYLPARPGGGGGRGGRKAPNNPMKTCTTNAHGVENNLPTRAPNRAGAYGVPETPGTAAIDRSQWLPPGSSSWTSAQANAYINQYRTQISGYIPNGNGGYIQVFNGVSDNMGPASGVAALIQRYPGRVLFELPGGQDLGNVNGMQFQVPSTMTCPNP